MDALQMEPAPEMDVDEFGNLKIKRDFTGTYANPNAW